MSFRNYCREELSGGEGDHKIQRSNEVIFCADERTAIFSRMAKIAERQQIDVTVAVKLRDRL